MTMCSTYISNIFTSRLHCTVLLQHCTLTSPGHERAINQAMMPPSLLCPPPSPPSPSSLSPLLPLAALTHLLCRSSAPCPGWDESLDRRSGMLALHSKCANSTWPLSLSCLVSLSVRVHPRICSQPSAGSRNENDARQVPVRFCEFDLCCDVTPGIF